MSGLHFEITGGNDSFKRSIEESRTITKRFIDEVEKGGKGIDELFRKGTDGQRLSVQMSKEAIAAEKLKQETSKASIQNSKAQIEAIKLELEQIKLLKQQGNSNADKIVHITQEITNATNEATQVFVKYAGSLDELDRRVKELTKGYLSMNAAQKASSQGQGVINEISILNSQRKIEADSLRALQKEYVNTQRMQDLQEGSITALRAQLSQLTATYDNMGRSMRNSASGKELIGSIQLVTTELNEAEQASMRFNRNVGNYASGWNGLSMQVQQVARELPAMAMGANTFFLAISNNLPMLADEIKRAKTEYKAFVAEGKNATPVWKQVASSLFSWQTALVAGVTILSMYGKEIISWAGSLFTAKKALSETYQSLEDFQQKVGESSGSVIATLEKLSNGWKRLGSDVDAQKKYIIDNKDAINSMGVSVNDAAEAERLFNTNKDTFILGILERAKAAATMELAAEEYKKAVQKMMEADAKSAEGVSFGDKFKSFFAKSAAVEDASGSLLNADLSPETFAKEKVDKLRKEAEDYRKSMLDLIYKAMGVDEEGRKKIEEAGGKLTDRLIDGSIEAIEAAIALKQQALKKVVDPKDYKRIEAEIKAEQAKLKVITGEKEKINYVDSYAQSNEIKKASQSVKDAILKSETDILQSQINLMDEGTNKQLAQIRLNYEKSFAEIRKGEREALQLLQNEERKQWEKKNPDYKKKNLQFVPTITKLPDEQKVQFGIDYSLAYEQQEKDADNVTKSLLDKYQDYVTQRIAIEKQFNADIAILQEERKRAQESGDTGKVETTDRAIAQATTDKGKSLMGMDYDKLKESPEYVRAFENLKETSSETLNSLLSQLENAKGTAAKVLSPDQLREYTTTIQEIMNELDERNPWQSLSDKKEELAAAEEELAQAQIALENARQTAETVKGGGKIESGVSSSKYNTNTGKIDSTKAYLTEAQALENVKTKTDNYNKSKDKVVEKSAKVKKSEKDITDQIDELSKAISDVGNSIGGPAGEIISLIGDIGNFTMMAISGVKMAADTSAQAISTVEKASVILMIISAAIQLATKVASMFAADYSDYNAAKENYEKYVEVLDVVIGKQKELIETLTGQEAVRASEDALRLIEKQAQAARNLGKERLNAGASAGSHSIGVRIKNGMSDAGWTEARNSLGEGAYNKIKDGRMTGLFDLSVQQLDKLQMNAPEFWAKLDDDVREYLEQIIACNESAGEMKDILNEALTGISFDSLSDSFLDSLTDMDASAADFADDFSSYMQKAILNTMMAKTYEKRLNDWYTAFAKANGDGVGIDSQEYKNLQGDWDKIVADALEERNAFKEQFGWTSGESSSQDSTNGGFATASQDSISELNGRFTAGQIAWEETKNAMLAVQASVNGISTLVSGSNITLMEIRNIALTSNSHLEDIAKYTKTLLEVGSKLDKIENNTKGLISR